MTNQDLLADDTSMGAVTLLSPTSTR